MKRLQVLAASRNSPTLEGKAIKIKRSFQNRKVMSRMVKTSARNTQVYKISKTSQGYIFTISQHFATKLGNSTNFNTLFLAVLLDFVLLAGIKIYLQQTLLIFIGNCFHVFTCYGK